MKATPWNHALNLLARRERSQQELTDRIQQKFPDLDSAELERLLIRLEESGLQSDQRFTESWIRARYQQGKGPVRIRHELREKGINESAAELYMGEDQFDWFQSAADVAQRKQPSSSLDFNDKGKLYRFLSYRGFTQAQIEHALSQYNCG